MDRLDAMEMFVRIVETGSFSAVARQMGTTQPTVSKQLTALEKRLGARLLQRSTRKLSLTESGQTYYDRCKRIVDEVREAEGTLGKMQTALVGGLHVNSSIGFGEMFVAPLILQFQQQYTELERGADAQRPFHRSGRRGRGRGCAHRPADGFEPGGAARRRDPQDRRGDARVPAQARHAEAPAAIWRTTTACSTAICRPATSGHSKGPTARSTCGCRAASSRTTGTRLRGQ